MSEFELDEKRIREAFETAVKYIAVSPRSEKEVKEKLYAKGFHKNEVEAAIDKSKGYNYINDENYVKIFLDFYKDKYGRKKLEYKLAFEKGINKELVANIIEDTLTDEFEIEKAAEFAAKFIKRKNGEAADRKTLDKAGAHLYQKGFEWDIINRALNRLDDVVHGGDFDCES